MSTNADKNYLLEKWKSSVDPSQDVIDKKMMAEVIVQSSIPDLRIKRKGISKDTGLFKCSGGMLQADIQIVMPPQSQMQTSDVKLSNSNGEYRYPITVGQPLKDG